MAAAETLDRKEKREYLQCSCLLLHGFHLFLGTVLQDLELLLEPVNIAA